MSIRVVIVGAGHAGGRLAEYLVNASDRFDVTLIGTEPVNPYERPPLSKNVLLGKADLDSCLLWKHTATADRMNLKLSTTVEKIYRDEKRVHLSDGSSVAYDYLVLATGSEVRNFSVPGDHYEGVMSLRSIADAMSVSDLFLATKNILVVGAGFIGLEVASIAAQRNVAPVVVEASGRPLARLVPEVIAKRIARMHDASKVTFRFGVMVERFLSDGRGNIQRAILSSGEEVTCDLAVIAVGVKPVVALAKEAELKVNVGVETDQQLRTSDPSIFAIGDIASFYHPLYKQHIRLESWQNAEDHAKIVAGVLQDQQAETVSVPFFWSDQYDKSLQILGLPHLGSSIRVKKKTTEYAILLHYDSLDRIVGATAFGVAENIGRELRQTRKLIASKTVYNPDDFGGEHLETLSDWSNQEI